MEKCERCLFWKEGRCRRFPPAMIEGWPRTQADDWCGEFEEKEFE